MRRSAEMQDVTEHLYVSLDSRIDLIAARLNDKLGLNLTARYNSCYGDYYHDSPGLLEEIRLYLNIDPLIRSDTNPPDGYWLEPDFHDYPLLLYVLGPNADVESFNVRLWHSCPRFDFGCVRTATYPKSGG